MKSQQKLVLSGGESQMGFKQLFASVLPELEKANKEFFKTKQSEAKTLIETDSKVHLKKIGDSAYKLLHYAGYADSRKTIDNRDSKNNSQQLKVIMN